MINGSIRNYESKSSKINISDIRVPWLSPDKRITEDENMFFDLDNKDREYCRQENFGKWEHLCFLQLLQNYMNAQNREFEDFSDYSNFELIYLICKKIDEHSAYFCSTTYPSFILPMRNNEFVTLSVLSYQIHYSNILDIDERADYFIDKIDIKEDEILCFHNLLIPIKDMPNGYFFRYARVKI